MTQAFTLSGDCLDELQALADNSIDSIVTDPPYGLSFMGKKWDYDVPSVEIWKECLRVIKPGGHLLSFSSARTYHRMVVNVEDAGFEIRDQIMWVYGSGFPKNHNIGNYIHKLKTDGSCREVKNKGVGNTNGKFFVAGKHLADRETPTSDEEWDGWGTALKPAHEPIVLARKPISEKNIAKNVIKWGTGGLNIDKSRVPSTESITINTFDNGAKSFGDAVGEPFTSRQSEGRFPANFIHDGSQQVLDLFPDSNGSGGSVPQTKVTGYGDKIGTGKADYLGGPRTKVNCGSGSAARFFYCAKAGKKEKDAGLEHLPISRPDTRTSTGMGSFEAKGVQPGRNSHPTVKPIKLMSYLINLVTPPGGTVLDPFMGSGSTGVAALEEGFSFLGVERDEDYLKIARLRLGIG